MDTAALVGQRLLLAFQGRQLSAEASAAIRQYKPAGLALFRSLNIDDPGQVRALTSSLQRLAQDAGLPPFIVAADQEGGQLMAVGEGTTPLPGNMALGAAGSTELARRAGDVLGTELAAMGINLNFAPSCDVNINPGNPVIGVRSFGEDPAKVAALAAAMIEGIQSAGVAATAKHFPGHGDTDSDSHHGLPSVPHTLERLQQVELQPFRGAIAADVKVIMSAHLALPALDGPDAPPATLSRRILHGLLREQMGFGGVIITDAMDMKAIRQGDALGTEAVRAAAAGADLLLMTSNPEDHRRAHDGLTRAMQSGELDADEAGASVRRILALKDWLRGRPQPDLSVVGCAAHQSVADEIAERSMTRVRDEAGLLPLRLRTGQRVAVVLPRPVDLTPADTSSYVTPVLAAAMRAFHPNVDEYLISNAPEAGEMGDLVQRLREYELLVLGTVNAYASASQAEFVRRALGLGVPSVVAALRLPYDLAVLPGARTYICTYGVLEPSMHALARALFGAIGFAGSLPVTIPHSIS